MCGVRERNLKSGVLKPEQVAAYLEALPDVSAQAEQMAIAAPGEDLDDDEPEADEPEEQAD